MNTNNIKVGQVLYLKRTFKKCVVVHIHHLEGKETQCLAGTLLSWEQYITVKVGSRKFKIEANDLCTKKEALKDVRDDLRFYTQQLKLMRKGYVKADKQLEKLLDAE